MITYTWKILSVDTCTDYTDPISGELLHDVIYACQWQITGTDDAGNSAWIYDRLGFTIGTGSIPRWQVTEADIVGWVQLILGSARIAELESQIADMLATLQS